MQVRFESQVLDLTARRLVGDELSCRELVARCRQLGGRVGDAAVAPHLQAFGSACGDALELIALDLGLVVASLGDAARVYDSLEVRAAAAFTTMAGW